MSQALSLEHSPPASPAALTARRSRRKTLLVSGVIVAILAIGALAWANRPGRGSSSEGLIFHEVKRQDLDILVTERGALESGKNTDLACEVEARAAGQYATTIIWIEKEGTQVEKGQKLVELDSASLRDQSIQQQIKVEQARAALTKAETDLDITRSQNESDIKKAEIDQALAAIDLEKYLKGDYVKERNTDTGKILIAEEQLKRSEERWKDSVRLGQKGYVSASEVDADRLSVLQGKNELEMAKEELRVLDQYTKNRSEKDFTSKRDEAKRALDRVQNQATAKEAQAEAAMLAQKLTTETEERTLEKLQKQLDKCTMYAPADGMVVYANDPSSSRGGPPTVQIEEGAQVRERQKIIRIPDLDSMLVNVKVHEARVSHVHPGQTARVRVESVPDDYFNGTVRSVATTSDSQSWFSTGVQVYTVMVAIGERVEGLKPGMTAEVDILADKVIDVVAVPVQGIVEREGQSYAYIVPSKGEPPVLSRVVTGVTNDKLVEIKEGLKAGARIVENVSAVINAPGNEEALNRIAKADAEKYKVEKAPAPELVKAEITKQAGPPANGKAARGPGGPGGPGGGAGGPGGGFTPPENGAAWIKQNDKNADGKVAKDELNEFAQQFFSTMDTNGDGFVDATEAEAVVQRMRARMQGGGGGQPAGTPPAGQ